LFLEDLRLPEEGNGQLMLPPPIQSEQPLVVDRKNDTGVISWNSTTISWDEIIDNFVEIVSNKKKKKVKKKKKQ